MNFRKSLSVTPNLRSGTFGIMLFSMLVVLLLSSVASAFTVQFPAEVNVGDEIVISGTGASTSELMGIATFNAWAPVATDRTYKYEVYGLSIPSSPNTLSVTANAVQTVKVSAGLSPVFSVSPASEAKANNKGVATVSVSDIPPLTYPYVSVEGSPQGNPSQVLLVFECQSYIGTNDDGTFVYTYDTDGLPEGTYMIQIHDGTSTVEFNVEMVPVSAQPDIVTVTSAEVEAVVSVSTVEKSGGEEPAVVDQNIEESSIDETFTEEAAASEQTVTVAVEDVPSSDDASQEQPDVIGKLTGWLKNLFK